MGSLLNSLRSLPPVVLAIWAGGALLVIVALSVLLFLERRWFARDGRQKRWLALRLAWLPIAAASLAGTWFAIPKKTGMESLAWFFILGGTLGPLLYFGLHAFVASVWGLKTREGMALATTGLLFVIVPAVIAGPTQSVGWMAQRAWSAREAAQAPAAQPGHILSRGQRLTLPSGEELWSQHWAAGQNVRRVESIEAPPYGSSGSSATQRFTTLGDWVCRDREDLHVTWPASMKETILTVRWRDTAGTLLRSELPLTPPPGEATPIAALWSTAGFTLSARPPRLTASPSVLGPDGKLHSFGSLTVWGAHESADDFCLPTAYRGERSIDGLALRIGRPHAEPLRAEFIR